MEISFIPRIFALSITLRELFEGLKIMDLEKDWKHYPVIRLDMSRGGANAGTLRSYLNLQFKEYENKYDITPDSKAQLADRFNGIITAANNQTGLQAVILIDEYDAPLQHSWKTPQHAECTEVYREVFAILKADDKYERFVFITGITKFTQIRTSLCSTTWLTSVLTRRTQPYAALPRMKSRRILCQKSR